MHKPLQVAMVGGGINSAVGRVHQLALTMDARFDLVAGCFSRNAERSRDTALAYAVDPKRSYGSLSDLLSKEHEKLDAVVIVTPTDQHKGQVIECLEAGLPVICEKALATNCQEIRDILASLDHNSGYLAVTYNYLGYPMLRELRSLIGDGLLGNVQQVHVEMPQEGFVRHLPGSDDPIVPQDWRLRDGKVPTVSLDLGVHLHSLTAFLTAEKPAEVAAISSTFGNFNQITDNVICMARYSNGLVSNIWYGKTALGQRNGLRVRVFGDKGSAEWYQEDPEYLAMCDAYGRRYTLDRGDAASQVASRPRYTRFKAGHPAGFIEAFANYYYDVADDITALMASEPGGQSSYVYGADLALEGMLFLEAIAEASERGCWVPVGG